MPVVQIVVNKEASPDTKKAVAKGLTEIVAAECRVPQGHVHVLILDNQFFSFGDNYEKTAAYVTVRSSAQQIVPEARRNLVVEMVAILTTAFADLDPYRINTFFEELPVENIAVGCFSYLFGFAPDPD
ncbi:hypothetical protein VOLCADRAFT_104979 [Volvox carteri f. nagariensis]|uniref:Uncharacterized protein n=1 Tax=Volvox carteri f. nagariensis TaxID=3068 RepID=D8TXK5_VOLCA|nr:uncharacterized protein VOLCADRAFT_104979 [Volvox carteri f. nagariensis]EFJ47740.1 hypothetical protein VOLCADRAFT_104979 [Volvox carteri f. nagariensis]|eukprot:XP_002951211.1 hypothetical protein VOLCADRAFT_104979 [Volvox carteri f. nagariensis]